ncbi:MAG: 16S rRNA (cytosine(1402)-N(4))-methyltransferase RsmH [Pseudomonadota bacterium]
MGHEPVLIEEVLDALEPRAGETYLDATYGGGGYSRRILAAADCAVLGLDRDLDAIERAEAHAEKDGRLTPLLGRFGDLDAVALNAGFGPVDGVVFDFGVSSFQLDEADRGFSFMRDGPLDMRMGQAGASAADVVNALPERDLANIIFKLGEEKRSRRIAAAIVQRRTERTFTTTLDLADTIEVAVGGRKGERIHPATRTFQAIRMLVNDELGEIACGLSAAERLLRPGGRLVVVTFHSLEDRMAKQFLRDRAGLSGGGSRHAPEKEAGATPSFELIQKKATDPSLEEIDGNPRSRSARLRFAVRTDAPAWPEQVTTGVDVPDISSLEGANA